MTELSETRVTDKPVKKAFTLLFIILTLNVSLGAFADEVIKPYSENKDKEALVLDLYKVVELVEEQSVDYAIARSQTRQAKSYFAGSFAPFLPSIIGQPSVEKFQGGEIFVGAQPVNLDRTTYRPTVSADYQIQTGGRDIFQVVAAKKQLNRANFAQRRIFQEALLKATTKYFTWLKNISAIQVALQALNESNNQVQVLESRVRNGFATKLEVLQAQTVHSQNKNLLLKVQNEQNFSKVDLSSDLNLPFLIEIKGNEAELQPINWVSEDFELGVLFETAIKNRPDLKELHETIEEAKARYKVAFADIFPTISLSGYIRGIGPTLNELDKSKQGQLSVSVNLLRNMGLGVASNILMARERVTEATLNHRKQLNEIQKTISGAYFEMVLYREQIGVNQQKIKETEEAYKIAMARAKNGVGINLDTIKAQTDLTEARLEYNTSIMNYNNAQLKLLFETGQLTPQKITDGLLASRLVKANSDSSQKNDKAS